MPFQPVSAPRCPKCGDRVYHAEEKIAAGQSFHTKCFKCGLCNKMLESTTLAEHDGDIYCKNCHGKKFGPKGYGYGVGAGCLGMDGGEGLGHTPDPTRGPAIAEAYTSTGSSVCPPNADRCPRCGQAVYLAEKMIGANASWHKRCFVCSYCGKKLDSTTMCDREGDIFCKACYAKGFGPKGVGYGIGAGALSMSDM